MNAFLVSVLLIALFILALSYLELKHKVIHVIKTHELVTIALFSSLLYVAGLPFKLGLGRIPFIQAFVYSVPFTAVLFIGIRVVPKPGTAMLVIVGHSLLSQIISRGINPLWWPYAVLAGATLETYFLFTRGYLNTRTNAVFAGLLRGLVMYLYFYLVSAPYIWHIHYASWYVFVQTLQGVLGSGLGALIGFALSRPILSAYRHGGL
ncbi:MAG TPA: hypothetical protein VMT62_00005 [Syntrophorhabdaceae bacterium]|nr:hypothetical protein [Syntrophorhabdaceae bacterium]